MIRFHWSLWNATKESFFLLSHSIATFKYFWGSEARYVVFTDAKEIAEQNLLVDVEIFQYDEFDTSIYSINALSTWKKWAPKCKFDQKGVEFHVDIDMFLLQEPQEIMDFIISEKKFLCLLENFKEKWPYGNFGNKLPKNFVPINAGFLGQNRNADLSQSLLETFQWWYLNIYSSMEKYHDEQGGVLWALLEYIDRGHVAFLPNERYRNVSPFDPPVEDVSKLCLIHTTCSEHPAFYKYIDRIRKISGLPGNRD